MLYIVESSKPLARLVADLEQAVTRNKFGVLAVHDLKAKMAVQCGLWLFIARFKNAVSF